jgi:hypothetical protein
MEYSNSAKKRESCSIYRPGRNGQKDGEEDKRKIEMMKRERRGNHTVKW